MLNTKPWQEMLEYARDTLETLTPARLRKMRSFVPYCWAYDGTGGLVLVNRQYKPLGVSAGAWVDYAAYPCHRIPSAEALPTEATALLNRSYGGLYFFADRCAPWRGKADARRLIAIIGAHLCETCPPMPLESPTSDATGRGAATVPPEGENPCLTI